MILLYDRKMEIPVKSHMKVFTYAKISKNSRIRTASKTVLQTLANGHN